MFQITQFEWQFLQKQKHDTWAINDNHETTPNMVQSATATYNQLNTDTKKNSGSKILKKI